MENDSKSGAKPGWRRCSACKKPIDFGQLYYVCSVSTCNRKRTALRFCDVGCWEVHLPVARHRESWAEERIAPTRAEAAREAEEPRPKRRILAPPRPQPGSDARRPATERQRPAPGSRPDLPREVLIIASRLKDYIRASSGMNTSERVLEPLSEIVREVCERAIENARANERKTVLDRDIERP